MTSPQAYPSTGQAMQEETALDARTGLDSGRSGCHTRWPTLDAVLNLPSLVESWKRGDLDQLRAELRGYDALWPGSRLLQVFEETVKRP